MYNYTNFSTKHHFSQLCQNNIKNGLKLSAETENLEKKLNY